MVNTNTTHYSISDNGASFAYWAYENGKISAIDYIYVCSQNVTSAVQLSQCLSVVGNLTFPANLTIAGGGETIQFSSIIDYNNYFTNSTLGDVKSAYDSSCGNLLDNRPIHTLNNTALALENVTLNTNATTPISSYSKNIIAEAITGIGNLAAICENAFYYGGSNSTTTADWTPNALTTPNHTNPFPTNLCKTDGTAVEAAVLKGLNVVQKLFPTLNNTLSTTWPTIKTDFNNFCVERKGVGDYYSAHDNTSLPTNNTAASIASSNTIAPVKALCSSFFSAAYNTFSNLWKDLSGSADFVNKTLCLSESGKQVVKQEFDLFTTTNTTITGAGSNDTAIALAQAESFINSTSILVQSPYPTSSEANAVEAAYFCDSSDAACMNVFNPQSNA